MWDSQRNAQRMSAKNARIQTENIFSTEFVEFLFSDILSHHINSQIFARVRTNKFA